MSNIKKNQLNLSFLFQLIDNSTGMTEKKKASVEFKAGLEEDTQIVGDGSGLLNKSVNVNLWHEEEEKPLGNFLNKMLDFNSLIPSNKEDESKAEKGV